MSIPKLTWCKEWLERGRLHTQAALRHAQQLLVERTKRKKGERHHHGFNEGDQVWLKGTNLRLSHPSAKLAPKRYGPFKVLREISPVVYRLKLPPHWTLHNVFHASLLTPYREMPEHGVTDDRNHTCTHSAKAKPEGSDEVRNCHCRSREHDAETSHA